MNHIVRRKAADAHFRRDAKRSASCRRNSFSRNAGRTECPKPPSTCTREPALVDVRLRRIHCALVGKFRSAPLAELQPPSTCQRQQGPTRGRITGTEVRSTHGDSHLGHYFRTRPEPRRIAYCINQRLSIHHREELFGGYAAYLTVPDSNDSLAL